MIVQIVEDQGYGHHCFKTIDIYTEITTVPGSDARTFASYYIIYSCQYCQSFVQLYKVNR